MEHCYAKNNYSAEMISFMGRERGGGGGRLWRSKRKEKTLDPFPLFEWGMEMRLTPNASRPFFQKEF